MFVTRAVITTGTCMNQAAIVLPSQSPQKPSTSAGAVLNRRGNMGTPLEYNAGGLLGLDIHIAAQHCWRHFALFSMSKDNIHTAIHFRSRVLRYTHYVRKFHGEDSNCCLLNYDTVQPEKWVRTWRWKQYVPPKHWCHYPEKHIMIHPTGPQPHPYHQNELFGWTANSVSNVTNQKPLLLGTVTSSRIFLGAFAHSLKAPLNAFTCPSMREICCWKLIKSVEKFQIWLTSGKNNGHITRFIFAGGIKSPLTALSTT